MAGLSDEHAVVALPRLRGGDVKVVPVTGAVLSDGVEGRAQGGRAAWVGHVIHQAHETADIAAGCLDARGDHALARHDVEGHWVAGVVADRGQQKTLRTAVALSCYLESATFGGFYGSHRVSGRSCSARGFRGGRGGSCATRGRFGDLMTAGRWLRRDHPEVASPAQWTLDLAFEYVRFVDGMLIGELLSEPRPNLRMGQPLTPNGKVGILAAMRAFFRDLQYWEWIERRFNPDRGFALPRQVQRSRERNPRPIDEAFWLKLRAASLSLRSEDLPRPTDRGQWRYPYPLEMIQALAVTWAFSGCRSNEIGRLEVGCAYVEHVPGQSDPAESEATPAFDQPMLRVPVNKTRGEFVKPVERPLLDAVLAWERLRPEQPALRDPTTGRMVHNLFCIRGRRVSVGVLNTVVIPILLRKAGLPEADSRGAITSHRARATLATKLYNGASGLGPLEVMGWLGHTHFSSTQHYLELTPVRLMTAFHKGAKLTENLRMIDVVVDSRPGPGDPVFHYDLGHGFCTNPAYASCVHRMACARCDFYEPAEGFAATLERQAARYVRMLQQLDLTEDERAATTGDQEAVEQLRKRLHHEPTPG